MCSEVKATTWRMMTENAKYFYDDITITDNYTFSESSNKNSHEELRSV
jgi:hypothetical protein